MYVVHLREITDLITKIWVRSLGITWEGVKHLRPVESILYRTGQYSWNFSYRNLNRYRNTFVSYRLKYRLYRVISALTKQIPYFGWKTYTGPEQKNQDFQIWKKEKKKKKVSLTDLIFLRQ